MSAAVNECEEGLANCDPIAECRDLPVGFECICPPGFTGNGTVCNGRQSGLAHPCHHTSLCHSTDIDECELGLDNCSPNAVCINTIGSFRCECLPGFTGDGITCDGTVHTGGGARSLLWLVLLQISMSVKWSWTTAHPTPFASTP